MFFFVLCLFFVFRLVASNLLNLIYNEQNWQWRLYLNPRVQQDWTVVAMLQVVRESSKIEQEIKEEIATRIYETTGFSSEEVKACAPYQPPLDGKWEFNPRSWVHPLLLVCGIQFCAGEPLQSVKEEVLKMFGEFI